MRWSERQADLPCECMLDICLIAIAIDVILQSSIDIDTNACRILRDLYRLNAGVDTPLWFRLAHCLAR